METILKKLQKRGFEAFYFYNRDALLEFLYEKIKKSDITAHGGSTTLKELGIINYLKENGYQFLDREAASTKDEREAVERAAFSADNYLMSTNALTYDGILVNIDNVGNRVAALIYGPRSVYIIVGKNKIVSTLEEAIWRARNIASPQNCRRLKRKTPCLLDDLCHDCLLDDSLCRQIVISRLSTPKNRIKVLILEEELGF